MTDPGAEHDTGDLQAGQEFEPLRQHAPRPGVWHDEDVGSAILYGEAASVVELILSVTVSTAGNMAIRR